MEEGEGEGERGRVVVLVAGLPGAGKSTLSRDLASYQVWSFSV